MKKTDTRVAALLLLVLSGCGSSATPVTLTDAGGRDAYVRPCGERGSATNGKPCVCQSDCADALALCVPESEGNVPGGMCLRRCESSADCGVDATCASLPSGSAICLSICDSTSKLCGLGRVCGRGECLAHCASDSECDSGHCDPWRAQCTDGTPSEGGGTFESCVRDEDCRSKFCHPAVHVCTSSCSLSRSGCPSDSVCVEDADLGDDLGVCALRCPLTGECPTERECVLMSTAQGTFRICPVGDDEK